jgi:predicted phage baseplate assembly protein
MTETNRPSLSALAFHTGAYGLALTAMAQQLTAQPELAELTTRDLSDPTMALLDAWACLSEVLSFYNERLVNECYLGTCTQRESAAELARLIGYTPRPGVAADTYLAFTLDDLNKEAELDVPGGTLAYSQPEPGETMQPFTTVEPLRGRPRWSAIRPRQSKPQIIKPGADKIYLKGLATGLKAGDKLLFEFKGARPEAVQELRTVHKIELQVAEGRTLAWLANAPEPARDARQEITKDTLKHLLKPAAQSSSTTPQLEAARLFANGSSAALELLRAAHPALAANLGPALRGSVHPGPTEAVKVYAMRVKAAIHGHIVPRPTIYREGGNEIVSREWHIDETPVSLIGFNTGIGPPDPIPMQSVDFDGQLLALDAVYDQIMPKSMVVLVAPRQEDVFFEVESATTIGRTAYNMPARVTQLRLDRTWLHDDETELTPIRRTTVYAQSELLELAEEPITDPVNKMTLDLDGFYDGLAPGRRLIVAGERELDGVTGVRGAELVQIAAVQQIDEAVDGKATGAALFTRISLVEPLHFSYVRTSVTIYANVAHASHGMRRDEVLGAGDASRRLQHFTLRQPPLTYRPAPNAAGIASTLEVQVNDLRWHPADDPTDLGPSDRRYLVSHADSGAVTLTFGMGARLPSGRDNVRASYLSGIGSGGNLHPGQISVLGSRPNGAMGVSNPLPATGGADPDDLARIRVRAPLAVGALDRPVSLQDYADIARNFGGIEKASAKYRDGKVHLTIAAVGDAPVSATSDLFHNLQNVFERLGGLKPHLHVRSARFLVIKASVQLQADYVWGAVRLRIRQALLDRFGFTQRELGQVAYASVVIASIQDVRGVAAVDLDLFGSLDLGSPDAPTPPDALAQAARKLFKPRAPTSQSNRAVLTAEPVNDAETILYLPSANTGLLLLDQWKASNDA